MCIRDSRWPPNGAGRICFLLIQTLPTFWAERIWILRIFFSFHFLDPNFWISRSPDLQIPKIPDFQVPRCPDAAACGGAGRTLRSQPDPSPNAPRDQIRRKGPCCDDHGPKGSSRTPRCLKGIHKFSSVSNYDIQKPQICPNNPAAI